MKGEVSFKDFDGSGPSAPSPLVRRRVGGVRSSGRGKRPARLLATLAPALLISVAALLVAGCGTGGMAKGGDPTSGKQLFLGEGRCASCHTLADAGSKGTIGPNLDDAFAADRAQGFEEDTIEQVVLDQIRLAMLPMPKDLVRGADARDVAAYVATCAAPPKPCNIQIAGAAPGGGRGAKLYASLGCQGCHTINGAKSTGPTFKGLFGSKVRLSSGRMVTADESYLLESILDPDKQIVARYPPGVMSATIKPHSVALADAKALVAFIKAQK